jgi:hypothetical protein
MGSEWSVVGGRSPLLVPTPAAGLGLAGAAPKNSMEWIPEFARLSKAMPRCPVNTVKSRLRPSPVFAGISPDGTWS